LCEFLDVPALDENFPRTNSRDQTTARLARMTNAIGERFKDEAMGDMARELHSD